MISKLLVKSWLKPLFVILSSIVLVFLFGNGILNLIIYLFLIDLFYKRKNHLNHQMIHHHLNSLSNKNRVI